jgi:hypothetical protein
MREAKARKGLQRHRWMDAFIYGILYVIFGRKRVNMYFRQSHKE